MAAGEREENRKRQTEEGREGGRGEGKIGREERTDRGKEGEGEEKRKG